MKKVLFAVVALALVVTALGTAFSPVAAGGSIFAIGATTVANKGTVVTFSVNESAKSYSGSITSGLNTYAFEKCKSRPSNVSGRVFVSCYVATTKFWSKTVTATLNGQSSSVLVRDEWRPN